MGNCSDKAAVPGAAKTPTAPVPKLAAKACGISTAEIYRMQDFINLQEAYKKAKETVKSKDADKSDEDVHKSVMSDKDVEIKLGHVVDAADRQFGLTSQAAKEQTKMCNEMGDQNPNNAVPDNVVAQRAWRDAKDEANSKAVEKVVTEAIEEQLKMAHETAADAVEPEAP